MTDFADFMEPVCLKLLGEPNRRLSGPTNWRYGTHGSLSVDIKKGVFHDHEGGEGGGVLDFIISLIPSVRNSTEARRWLRTEFDAGPPPLQNNVVSMQSPTHTTVEAEYFYYDADGVHVYTVKKFRTADGNKTYRPFLPNANKAGLGDVEKIPYNLPQLLKRADATVYVVEGEKDVNSLTAAGLLSTCNSGGAGNWYETMTAALVGRDVIVLPDNDKAGRKHAQTVVAALQGKAASVKVVELPGLPERGDVSDYLESHTAESLQNFCDGYKKLRASGFSAEQMLSVQPRKWLYGRHLIEGYVSATVSAGGAGKTTLELIEAVAMATGRDLIGAQSVEPVRVWHYNLEDPLDELYRRVWAICEHFEVPPAELEGQLYLDSGRERKLLVAGRDGEPVVFDAAQELTAEMQENGIKVLQIDPFVKVHQLDENNNPEIDFVCSIFADIAQATGGCVDLVHHIRKAPTGAMAQPGNIDQARGASALSGAVRAARTLSVMTEREAETLGILSDRRGWYVRVDDAKANMSAPVGNASWFERRSINLPNADIGGDSVGVFDSWSPPDPFDGLSTQAARDALLIIREGLEDGQRYQLKATRNSKRWAGSVLVDQGAEVSEHDAKQILKEWLKIGMIFEEEYQNPKRRKPERGLFINMEMLPGQVYS